MGWLTGRPNTVFTKHSLWFNWVRPYLKPDGSNLDSVVQMWEEHLQPNSVKSVLYVAKAWVKDETGVELPIKAHIARVSRSKQQLPIRTLSKEEIVALSAVCKAEDSGLYLPFMLALHTGMRRGEVWGLTWEDIDILKGEILISKSYKGPTKNGKSRYVPISFALEKALIAKLPIKSYNCSETVIDQIFDPNPRLRRACRLAGVREINFHCLRHSFATLALESGRSPKLVSQTLGHSQVSTTVNLYWAQTQKFIDLGFLPDE